MLVLKRETSVLSMAPGNKPAASCKAGETVKFETLDCFSNEIRTEDRLFSTVGWECINPATGPLYVEGAEPGDILAVEILSIDLDTQGVMTSAKGFGALGDIMRGEVTKIVPIKDGKAVFDDRIELELSPMIGVIGTAPKDEEIPTGTPGPHGGNMDCKRIGVGSTVYLPVNVPGALLAMGDMHAAMGDGEIVVTGIEISGEITVKIEVLKGRSLPLPLVKRDGDLMAIASADTLDNASQLAIRNMHALLVDNTDLTPEVAAMLLSAAGDLRICQIVDPLVTVRMELALRILEKYGFRI